MTTSKTPSPSPIIGFYHHVRDTRFKTRPVSDIAKLILKGSRGLDRATVEARRLYQTQEAAFRAIGSPEKPDRKNQSHTEYYQAYDSYTSLKATLPAATFSGVFQDRTDATMVSHSGLIGVDLDHLARAGLDAESVRDACAALPYTVAAFVSPSGDGVKVFALVTPVPETDAEHRRAWAQVVEAYSDVAPVDVSDPATKNPARLCFLAHDLDAVFKAVEDMIPLQVDLSEVREPPPPAQPVRPAGVYHGDHDRQVDREALRHIPPPENYDEWVAWLTTLKALYFTVDEVEAWSSHGAKYTPGEVTSRWAKLREDPEDEARDKLRGHAYNVGWRQGADDSSKAAAGQKNQKLHRLRAMRRADKSDWVWVAESPQDSDRLADIGLVAVSSPGPRWQRSYSKALKDRRVAVIPGSGSKSINSAVLVANSVADFAAEVRIVHVDGLAPDTSVSDYISAGGTADGLRDMLDQAVAYVADPEVEDREDAVPDSPQWRVSPLLGDAKRLTRLMKTHGFFVDAGDEAFFFDQDNHRLIPLNGDDRSFIILLGERYSINRRDQLFTYLLEHLLREAYVRGRKALVRRFSYFNKEENVVYLDMAAGYVLKISKEAIEQRHNGDDAVLFLPMAKHEPWRYIPQQADDLLFKLFIEPLNFSDEGELDVPQQRALLMAWLLSMAFESLMPTKVLAAAVGPSGSGKSTMFRHAGKILIGPRFQLSAMSKEQKGEDNFFVKLKHSFFCCFDNIDEGVRWLPDALAQIATGIERPGRVLYTDDQLLETAVSCMVSVTSRTPRMCLRREDVASRTLLFNFEKLKEVKPEYEMEVELNARRDQLMSDYANLLQRVLAHPLDNVKPADPSMRMADFARIATWIGAGLGPKRSQVMAGAITNIARAQHVFAIEQDPFTAALEVWLTRAEPPQPGATRLDGYDGVPNDGRRVSARYLFQELNGIAREFNIRLAAKSPDALGKYIGNHEEALAEKFIINKGRQNNSRWWEFHFNDGDPDNGR